MMTCFSKQRLITCPKIVSQNLNIPNLDILVYRTLCQLYQKFRILWPRLTIVAYVWPFLRNPRKAPPKKRAWYNSLQSGCWLFHTGISPSIATSCESGLIMFHPRHSRSANSCCIWGLRPVARMCLGFTGPQGIQAESVYLNRNFRTRASFARGTWGYWSSMRLLSYEITLKTQETT